MKIKLFDLLNCYLQEEKTRGTVAKFQPNVLMLGLSPSDYVLRSISNVKPNDIEQTLLVRTLLSIYFHVEYFRFHQVCGYWIVPLGKWSSNLQL